MRILAAIFGLWWVIVASAWAQEPDATALFARARADLLRSEGCVIVDVAITQHQQQGMHQSQSQGVIRARLDQGTWLPLGVRLEAGSALGADMGDGLPLLLPILGRHSRMDGQPISAAHSTLLLEVLAHDIELGGVGQDAQGQLILQHLWRSRDGLASAPRANTLVATFDETGQTRRWQVDVQLRERNEHGTLRRMSLDLSVDAEGIPTQETLSLQTRNHSLQRTAKVRRVMDCDAFDANVPPSPSPSPSPSP